MKEDLQDIASEWERYQKVRESFHDRLLEVGGRYDKLLLAIQGGGFVLPITFIEKIVHHPPVYAKFLLSASWLAFGIGIFFQLWAMKTASGLLGTTINQIDHDYLKATNQCTDGFPDRIKDLEKETKRCFRANTASFSAALCGLFFVAAFAIASILIEQPIYSKKNDSVPPTSSNLSADGIDQKRGVCPPKASNSSAKTPTREIAIDPKKQP